MSGQEDEKRDALDRLVMEMFRARDEAIRNLAVETERMRGQQNEWRASLSDLSDRKIDRETFETRMNSVDDKFKLSGIQVARLSEELAQTRGSVTASNRLYGLAFAAAGIAIAVFGILGRN